MESIEIEERSDIIIGGKAGFSMAVHEGMGKLIVSRKQEGLVTIVVVSCCLHVQLKEYCIG